MDLPLPVVSIPLPARCVDPEAILALLAAQLGVAASEDEAAASLAIAALPPRVIIVDDLQRLFLRSVGGYDALRALLDIAHATAGVHFWVTSSDAAAWGVISGLTQRVPLGGYRAIVRLRPLGEPALRAWLSDRASAAGFSLRFDLLQAADTDAHDRQRIEAAWFRMVGEASTGEPAPALAALAAFAASVRPDERLPGVLQAVPLESPSSEVVARLGDNAHFALAAILTHRRLDLASLIEVLNLPRATVRAACLDLQGRGIVAGDASAYSLEPLWIPAVRRVLGQRHFLETGP